MRVLSAFLALTWLAACGVDGPPQPPKASVKPGLTITGDAAMGVSGSL